MPESDARSVYHLLLAWCTGPPIPPPHYPSPAVSLIRWSPNSSLTPTIPGWGRQGRSGVSVAGDFGLASLTSRKTANIHTHPFFTGGCTRSKLRVTTVITRPLQGRPGCYEWGRAGWIQTSNPSRTGTGWVFLFGRAGRLLFCWHRLPLWRPFVVGRTLKSTDWLRDWLIDWLLHWKHPVVSSVADSRTLKSTDWLTHRLTTTLETPVDSGVADGRTLKSKTGWLLHWKHL